MQAVILAAGLGRRLGALTERSTKCMVRLHARPLIEYAFDALVEAQVERVVLVVGHGADEVRGYLGARHRGVPVHYVFSPRYAETNNIASLHLAASYLREDDTLLLESDVVFERSILTDCASAEGELVAVLAPYRPWMDGTVVLLDRDDRPRRFVCKREFRWADAPRYMKTVNLYKLSRRFSAEHLVSALTRYIAQHGMSAYYEEVLRAIVGDGDLSFEGLPVGARRWVEIDDPYDLEIASATFASDPERLLALQARFGGYWRFPWVEDLSYLSNVHYPPPALLDELAQASSHLICGYPSGAAVQARLAGRLLGCDPARLAVGNGAAELIDALARALGPDAVVGVPVPTFDGYLGAAAGLRTVQLPLAPPGFTPDLDALAEQSLAAGVTALVLVNPAIPSGHFSPLAKVRALALRLARDGVRLIVDESFVDFVDVADEADDASLLRDSLLEAHPNLIVIRSLSKSHGVPGLRLGVLATDDGSLLGSVCARLPLWNVNAQAEYFLQSAAHHQEAYRAACARTIADRAELLLGLSSLRGLRPLPSQANFVLCEVRRGSAARLTRRLLAEHRILAKDCSRKPGMAGGEYVRFAVREAAVNARLIEALARMEREPEEAIPHADL